MNTPNKPDELSIARLVAAHDQIFGQIPMASALVASLELFQSDQLATLHAQLEAAEDSARLDWLESKSKFVTSTLGAHRGYHELPSVAINPRCNTTGATAGPLMTPATLREAIDAARCASAGLTGGKAT